MVSNSNANNIPAYSLHSKFVKNIMDSMILWYDVKRQGTTNESMSQNPVLRDLSGNGHDATCYNFAWSGMSGIGGYSTSFLGDGWMNIPEIVSVNDNSCIFTEARNSTSLLFHSGYLDEFNIKVTGITNTGCRLEFGQGDVEESEHSIKSDGVYTIPAVTTYTTVGFKLYGDNSLTLNVKIELLPQYPNALVSDGVDDCAMVKELPILTDYTVIAKRKWIKTEYDTFATFSSKTSTTTNGEFIFERFDQNGNLQVLSFGVLTAIETFAENITYQTPTSYNGKVIGKGNFLGDGKLTLFGLRAAVQCPNIALYSFILFDRTLIDEEIEWVKTNLIETEE